MTSVPRAWRGGCSRLLDAPLVLQRYSRLVQDCNRPPEAPSAMPEMSESTPIPGNAGLTPEERAARTAAITNRFTPPSRRCSTAGRRAAAIELRRDHSFTPVYKGMTRHLDVGVCMIAIAAMPII
jgi:predicted N-formylglutamate amidohydrolase